VVMQNDVLMTGSIIENISFFDIDPDITLVKECAKLACVDEFVESLPMKYDSIVGQRGQGFSAGQIQRMVLARALYRQPKVLFLDEFSSNMDEKLEHAILTNLKSLGITILSVAHRRQVINACTRTYKLQNGNFYLAPHSEEIKQPDMKVLS
jgi:ATP-binding cassette subfamily B protein RaxB